MNILITYPTALYYWRTCNNERPIARCSVKPSNLDSIRSTSTSSTDKSTTAENRSEREYIIRMLEAFGLKRPFHIYVPKDSHRYHGKIFHCHVFPNNIPPRSFVELSDGIYIICPELCYILAANDYSLAEHAVLACDLCGTYALCNYEQYGQISRYPITTVGKILAYTKNTTRLPGLLKARTSIKYALNRSNSPMESKLAVIAILPRMHGGFGLKKPELNGYVTLSSEGADHLQRNQCCCDMLWRAERVVVEYDSNLVHLSPNQIRYDKRKSTALQASFYHVIHVTRDSFRNFNTVEELFRLIRKALHIRSANKDLEKYRMKRHDVIKSLFLTSNYY